jgi:hypothetical protein
VVADVVYAAAWVFDLAFATWVVARLWQAGDAETAVPPAARDVATQTSEADPGSILGG